MSETSDVFKDIEMDHWPEMRTVCHNPKFLDSLLNHLIDFIFLDPT